MSPYQIIRDCRRRFKCAKFTAKTASWHSRTGDARKYFRISASFVTVSAAFYGLISNNIPPKSPVQAHTFDFGPLLPSVIGLASCIGIFTSGCPRPVAPGAKITGHILPLCPPCPRWPVPALSRRCGHMCGCPSCPVACCVCVWSRVPGGQGKRTLAHACMSGNPLSPV